MAVEPRARKSAEERREEILVVAVRHFAIGGLHGTSTEAIAREAGISQPYLFRLYRTKKELFLACVDRADGKVSEVFRRAAAAAPPGERMQAMGQAYIDELLPDRHAVLMQMQGYAATSDPDIRAHVRSNYERLVREVTELAETDPGSVWAFFAQGMLLNVTQSLDLQAIADESEWAASWCNGPPGGVVLERLAGLIDRRRRAVLLVAVLVVFAAGAYGGPVVGLLDVGDDFSDPGSESIRARDTVERTTGRSAAPDALVLVRLGARVEEPEAGRRLEAVTARIREGDDVAEVGVPEPGRPSPLVSEDRRSVYLPVTFFTAADEDDAADALVERMRGEPGVTVGGGIVAFNQVGEQVESDLQRAEMLAAPILLLFSLLVFRSLVAALLPLAVGTATVLLTFSGLRIINEFEPMSTFAINLTTGLGLGLAIDYSLFMVSRFREELEADGDRSRALHTTVRTAGRTVLFSAFTVAAALAAMLVFPLRFLYSMGAGGVLVALSAALVSLTLLPALLAVLGPRVNALGLRRWQVAMRRDAAHVQAGPWYRLSRAVMRRPAPVAGAAAVLLIVMGLPFLRVEFTGVDASVLPAEKSAKVVDEALRSEFPPGPTAPVLVVAGVGERGSDAAQAYGSRLAGVDGVASVGPPEQAGGYWIYDVVPERTALSASAQEVVRDVRGLDEPFPVQVGGETAGFLDQQTSLGDSLPLALAILATTTLLILFAMTGSVVLPIKALVMNLLTVSAAFGLLVLIFQDGRFEGLLAYDSQGALEATQPILLFCVAFGLSTDYGVFLLTRIKEARDGGAGERESVAVGLERTGRIVTYAALLFCIAIGAFASSQVVFIKEVGVGTALAVLIDAFLVRALLVPSLMALLGRWNWWAPRPLARLHARIGLQEA